MLRLQGPVRGENNVVMLLPDFRGQPSGSVDVERFRTYVRLEGSDTIDECAAVTSVIRHDHTQAFHSRAIEKNLHFYSAQA